MKRLYYIILLLMLPCMAYGQVTVDSVLSISGQDGTAYDDDGTRANARNAANADFQYTTSIDINVWHTGSQFRYSRGMLSFYVGGFPTDADSAFLNLKGTGVKTSRADTLVVVADSAFGGVVDASSLSKFFGRSASDSPFDVVVLSDDWLLTDFIDEAYGNLIKINAAGLDSLNAYRAAGDTIRLYLLLKSDISNLDFSGDSSGVGFDAGSDVGEEGRLMWYSSGGGGGTVSDFVLSGPTPTTLNYSFTETPTVDSTIIINDADSSQLDVTTGTSGTVTGLTADTEYIMRAVGYASDTIASYSNADTFSTTTLWVIRLQKRVNTEETATDLIADTLNYGQTPHDSIAVIDDTDSSVVASFVLPQLPGHFAGRIANLTAGLRDTLRFIGYHADTITTYGDTVMFTTLAARPPQTILVDKINIFVADLADSVFHPGDSIFFDQDSLFDDVTVILKNSGSPEKGPIFWGSDVPGKRVLFRPLQTAEARAFAVGQNGDTTTASYNYIKDIEVDTSNGMGMGTSRFCHNNVFDNVRVRNTGEDDDGIYIFNDEEGTPTLPAPWVIGGTDTIRNCVIDSTGGHGLKTENRGTYFFNDSVRYAGYADNANGAGISLATDSRGATVLNSYITNSNNEGIRAASSDVNLDSTLIRGVKIDSSGGIPVGATEHQAIRLAEAISNVTVEFCTLQYSDEEGIKVNTSGNNILIQNNIISNNDSSGILLDRTSDTENDTITIRYNDIQNNGFFGIEISSAFDWRNNVHDYLIYYNVIANNDTAGIRTRWLNNQRFYNNTIVKNGLYDAVLDVADMAAINVLYKNNIADTVYVDDIPTMDFDYFDSTGQVIDSMGTRLTLAEFQGTGQEANGAQGTVLFTDKGANDFTLQAGSPAINAGTNLGLPNRDFAGNPILGIPDIGAYEFGAAATIDSLRLTVLGTSSIRAEWDTTLNGASLDSFYFQLEVDSSIVSVTTDTSDTATGLAAGTTYVYRIAGLAAGVIVAYSDSVSATTDAAPVSTTTIYGSCGQTIGLSHRKSRGYRRGGIIRRE